MDDRHTTITTAHFKRKVLKRAKNKRVMMALVCSPGYVNLRIFKLTDFGIKQAKVIIFTNYEGSPSSF